MRLFSLIVSYFGVDRTHFEYKMCVKLKTCRKKKCVVQQKHTTRVESHKIVDMQVRTLAKWLEWIYINSCNPFPFNGSAQAIFFFTLVPTCNKKNMCVSICIWRSSFFFSVLFCSENWCCCFLYFAHAYRLLSYRFKFYVSLNVPLVKKAHSHKRTKTIWNWRNQKSRSVFPYAIAWFYLIWICSEGPFAFAELMWELFSLRNCWENERKSSEQDPWPLL